MPRGTSNLYMMVDKSPQHLPLIVGTMEDICQYSGKSQNTIRSLITKARQRNSFCQYINLGKEKDYE